MVPSIHRGDRLLGGVRGVRGDLEPIKALMQGKLRVRGDLPKILRYVKGTQELAYIAGQVDTTFPDES